MGYLTQAFVFKDEPDWAQLGHVAKSLSLLAVRHDTSGLCLLWAWDPARDEPAHPYAANWQPPFVELVRREAESLPDDAPIERFAAAAEVASDEYCANDFVRPMLQLASLLSKALAAPLFAFVANDEGANVAALFDDKGLQSALADGYTGVARCEAGRVSLSPLLVVEQMEDTEDLEIDFTALEHHDEVVVHPTRVLLEEDAEGRQICSSALALWPAGWPAPDDSLGLGTWDPFAGYPQAFTTVFTRRVR